jgi:flagellar basal-body rod protein FlgB
MGMFDDPVKTSLLRTLDATALRQKVIADNIANADTPGFKKSVVHFEDALAKALSGNKLPLKITDPRHIGANPAGVQPRTERVTTTSLRTDGNNVEVEEEMMNMVTNTITYRSATQFLSGKYAKLRYVISGGR